MKANHVLACVKRAFVDLNYDVFLKLYSYEATGIRPIMEYANIVCGRVKSESDDLDSLDHFFGGSSGFHLQAKLSGCDPDITCSLENSIGIW